MHTHILKNIQPHTSKKLDKPKVRASGACAYVPKFTYMGKGNMVACITKLIDKDMGKGNMFAWES